MPGTKLSFVLFISFVFVLSLSEASAQSRQRLRELEKTKQEQRAEEQAAIDAAKKRHQSIQTKQTRKEMKKYERQSRRVNKNQRQPFWKRWFGRSKQGRVRKRK